MSKPSGAAQPQVLAAQAPQQVDGANIIASNSVTPQPQVHVPPKPLVLPLPRRDVLPPLNLDREVRGTKHASLNAVLFHVKAGAGILYSLLHPSCSAYEPPDVTWLKLLEAISLIPSGKPHGMVEIIGEVYRIMPMGEFRNRFQSDFRHELYVKSKMTPREGLILKDKVNRFLRAFMADPIHGFVFARSHIHNDHYADDVVRTPVGNGRVRAFRSQDNYYIVVYPWGHGYIHSPSLSSATSTDSRAAHPATLKRSLETAMTAPVNERKTSISKAVSDAMQRAPDSIMSKAYVLAMAQRLSDAEVNGNNVFE